MSALTKDVYRFSKLSAAHHVFLAIALALSVVTCVLPAVGQVTGDTRTVTEPQFPTTICQTLQANLQAAAGTLSGVDESADASYDTGRIQAAIDACNTIYTQTSTVQGLRFSASGGNNAFLTAPILLKSGVVLLVDPEVIIFGSRRTHDYDKSSSAYVCGTIDSSGSACNPLIGGASGVTNAGIMGYGVIDGQGGRAMIGNPATCYTGLDCTGYKWWELADLANTVGKSQNNPRMMNITGLSNFTMYKITLRNSTKFHAYIGGNGITLWGVKISAPYDARNTDAFDPTGATNVTLTKSYISVGDDEVAIKAASASSNMTFSQNHFYSGHGMSVGSETNGGLNNVLVTDLVMAGDKYDTNNNGLRIKSDSSRGGLVQNILFDGVCIKDTDHPLVFDTYYSSSTGTKYPNFKSITVKNTHIVDDAAFHYFSSTENVAFNGYSATYPLGITLDNVVFDPVIGAATTTGRFLGQYVNLAVGPGPVSFASQLPNMSPGSSAGTITVTPVTPANSNPPYDCTNKWVYLAGELFSSPISRAAVNIDASDSLPLTVILQPLFAGSETGSPAADPLPQGTVSILDNGNPTAVATATLSTTGWITPISVTGLAAGQHTLTAHYSGDSTYSAKYKAMDFGSVTVNVAAGPAVETTTVVTATPATTTFGDTVTLTATVSSSTGTPTGTVAFYDGATLLATGTLASGAATYSASGLSVGTHSIINARYDGAPGFNPSTSSVVSVTVGQASSSTTVSASPASVMFGQAVTLTANVTSTAGTPTGTVTFKNNATTLGTGTLNAGVATYSTSSLALGTHDTITAVYEGDANFATSTSQPITVTINAQTTTTLTSSASTVISGSSLTFTATVTSLQGTPAGNVTFYDGATQIGSGTLNASGVATATGALTISGTTTETHSITARYLGAGNFATSTSAALAVSVNPVPAPDFSISASPSTVNVAIGGSGTTTLTLTPLNGFNASVTLGCGTLPSYVTCTFSQNPLALSGTATPVTLTVHVAGTTAALQHHNSLPFGPLTLPAMLAFVPLMILPGRKKLPVRLLIGVSICLLMISWAGCGGGGGGVNPPATPSATTTTLVASPTTINLGGGVTLTATVASGGGTPTGSVVFAEGATTLGTGALNASGVATYSTSALALGSHSVVASYAGTTRFSSSSSSTTVVKVNPPTGATTFALTAGGGGSTHSMNVTVNIVN